MAVDETYFLRPGETTAAYNARIAAYNASKTSTPVVSGPAPVASTPTSQYQVGQTVTGGNANSDGSIKYVYTYLGNDNWKQSDTLGREYGGVTKTTSQLGLSSSTPTQPSGTQQPASTIQPPTVALQPGDTGDQVKKLQDYLVSKGLLTQAQVNTGYGTYGPQTTAAVAALQSSLGVDNSTGVGYFGPRTIAAVSSATPAIGTTGANTQTDPALASVLNNPNLTPDQKATLQSIYGAVSSNDADTAAKIKAAMTAASEFSDPYFKAQIRLAVDALDRGISAKEGDLAYDEKKLAASLKDLQDNTAASKDMLSFDHAQELAQLATKLETDLGTTRDNLAATGFTTSTKRARAETILNEQNAGLVEGSNKKFTYQTGNLDRALTSADASTQAQIENLRRLTAEGKLDLYRNTESAVGSANLPVLSGMTPLGNVGGDIPRKQVTDSLAFANNFVF